MTKAEYIANLQGCLGERNKQVELAFKQLHTMREHLHSDKFTGVDADGERKDWIATKDVDSFVLQLIDALCVPIDFKVCNLAPVMQETTAFTPVFTGDAQDALDQFIKDYAERPSTGKPGVLVGGYYKLIAVDWHTAQFITLDGWELAVQIPWLRGDGTMTTVGELVQELPNIAS